MASVTDAGSSMEPEKRRKKIGVSAYDWARCESIKARSILTSFPADKESRYVPVAERREVYS
jgi:hypothetical protein